MTYPAFGKIPRWNREVVLTEKLDGTNGLVAVCPPGSNWQDTLPGRAHPPRFRILPDGTLVAAGSRKRWLTPQADNFDFAAWVWDHAEELAQLGKGAHYGEYYGRGINRGYGLPDRHFALFNVSRWDMDSLTAKTQRPKCCEVVTSLAWPNGNALNDTINYWLSILVTSGSVHVPGYNRPEGIVLYHTAGDHLYKVTLEGDQAKTPDGYVVQPAGSDWLGLKNVREALNNYTNKDQSLMEVAA
jgi:hypothetical protein